MASLFTRPVSLPLSASVFLSSFSSAPLSVSTFFCLKRHVMSETKRAAFLSGYSSIPGISATATCLSVSHRVTIQTPSVSQDLRAQPSLRVKVLGPSDQGKGSNIRAVPRGGGAAQCLMFLGCFSPYRNLWMWSVCQCGWTCVPLFGGMCCAYLCVSRPQTCLMLLI